MKRLKDTEEIPEAFSIYEFVEEAELDDISLGEGIARIKVKTWAGLFTGLSAK